MDMGIIPAGRSKGVVVGGGVGHLSADVDRGSVDQAVDERGVGVLENLLDGTGKLVGRLRPVVVFEGDHEDRLDSFRVGLPLE
jgi:hypothetical protein